MRSRGKSIRWTDSKIRKEREKNYQYGIAKKKYVGSCARVYISSMIKIAIVRKRESIVIFLSFALIVPFT